MFQKNMFMQTCVLFAYSSCYTKTKGNVFS